MILCLFFCDYFVLFWIVVGLWVQKYTKIAEKFVENVYRETKTTKNDNKNHIFVVILI